MLESAHSSNNNQRNTKVIFTVSSASKLKDIMEKLFENKHDGEIVLDANREELRKSILIFYKKALNNVSRLNKEKFSEVMFWCVLNYFLFNSGNLKVEDLIYHL